MDPASTVEAWHPLSAHCADVAACMVRLLGLWDDRFAPTLLNRRLARSGGHTELDDVQVARLGVLTALHDLGKFNHGFQAKRGADRQLWAGHVAEVVPLISAEDAPSLQRSFLHAIEWPMIESWFIDPTTAAGAMLAVVSHHGRPAVRSEGGFRDQLWQPTAERDPITGIRHLVVATKSWLPLAWQGASRLPDRTAFIHALAGLVQLSDWLGSDTSFFPFSCGEERWRFACNAADRAVTTTGLEAKTVRRALKRAPSFADLSDDAPRPMQTAVSAMSLPASPGSVTLIEDETGSGKTEAAVLYFARLFQCEQVDGMYFALPTRTAATQLFERITALVARLFPSGKRPAVILAVPGYLRADDTEGRRLPGFEVLWPDTGQDRHRYWAAEHPKRYLAGTVIVGTIDQVLLSALAVDHSHLRASCLLRHLVVVDEVHASDTYMTALLGEVLARHRAAGGHALLLSATLGSTAAATLLTGRTTLPPTWEEARLRSYPCLTVAADRVSPVQALGQKQPVSVELAAHITDPGWIAASALAAARQGARVLIVRNTVSGCLTVQNALEQQDDGSHLWRIITPDGAVAVAHHARFARDDRQQLDMGIEQVLGRRAGRTGGLVCCATQTVQQSLDLDADYLLTDLCPLDVLLQRIGRLHRHRRGDRAAEFTMPRCQILVPDKGPDDLVDTKGKPRHRHGLGTVYADLAVLATSWTALIDRQTITIPAENRTLVEATTHPEALKPWRTRDDRWRAHANHQTGIGVQHRQQARCNLARWDLPFDHQEVRFPSGDLDKRIMTRLGEGDRRIEFEQPIQSPLGQSLPVLTIPAWLLRGVSLEQAPRHEIGRQALLLHYPDRIFIYDRFGLRLLRDHAEDDYVDS